LLVAADEIELSLYACAERQLSDRSIAVRAKDCIDAGLVSRTLSLETFQDVLFDAKGNGCLRRLRLESSPDDTAYDVTHIRLGMVGSRSRPSGPELCPVSL
jgi:hypothetical protein